MPGKISTSIMKAILSSPVHAILGKSFAVIYVTGSKPGKVYSTPINVSHEDDTMLVFSYRNRTW